MTAKEKCDVQYVLVAPNGGWGYLICLAGVINLITIGGFISSFGMIYNDFMREIGIKSTGLTVMNGITAVSIALGAFLTSPLQKIMSMRQITLMAVLIYNFGTICMVFVKSLIPFYICVGMMQGAGFGILFNISYAMVNEYFDEKRLFAYSIMKTAMAIFAMFAPQLVKVTLAEYGFRGTILMISAVSLHSLIAVALMQPVSWHMKKVKKQPLEEETRVLLIVEKNGEIGCQAAMTDPTIIEPIESKKAEVNNVNDKKSSWLLKKINGLFDLALMKSLLLSNVSWGIALSAVTDSTFLYLLPQALYSYNWSKDNVALALTLIGFGDLAGRGFFIFLSKWLNKVGSQEFFIGGIMISVAGRIGITCSSSVTVALISVTLYGVGRAFLALFIPMVISEVVGTQKFTAAMGFIMILMGCVNLGGGPILGAIRDYTNSYDIAFWIMASLLIISVVSWTIAGLQEAATNEKRL